MISLLGVLAALIIAFIPYICMVTLFGFGCLMLVGITAEE